MQRQQENLEIISLSNETSSTRKNLRPSAVKGKVSLEENINKENHPFLYYNDIAKIYDTK